MAEKTAGIELLELAIEIEKNGYNFYKSASKNKNKEVQNVFTQLAEREKEHLATFHDMLGRLGDYKLDKKSEDYEYIKNLAASSVFTDERAEIQSRKMMTDVEAIEVGMGLEKDCILLYSGVRDMVSSQDRNIIDMITNEEKEHLSELTYIANKLKGM